MEDRQVSVRRTARYVRYWHSEPTALAAGLEVVVQHEKQSHLSTKSIKKPQHWSDGLQIEPPDFETRG
jgi:hypothetical protein